MKHIPSIIAALTLLIATLARAQADEPASVSSAPLIDHVPWNEARAGQPIELTFRTSAPDRIGVVSVHVLPDPGHPQPLTLAVRRTAAGYHTIVPAERVQPPALQYYVDEQREDGAARLVFASSRAPHRVRVSLAPQDEVEQTRLRERKGKRSSIVVQAEAVSFGAHKLTADGPSLADRYYWLEAGYAYAALTRVEEVALHLFHMRGEAGEQRVAPQPHAELSHPGFDAGRATITWRLFEPLRLRTALLLGASQRGFEYGGALDLVVGDPQNVSLELGGQAIRTLGETAHLRLGFRALPNIPMGAAIEITTFPTNADPGVRLLYDVGYRFDPTTEILLRAGYQGRSSVAGGPSLGLSLRYGF